MRSTARVAAAVAMMVAATGCASRGPQAVREVDADSEAQTAARQVGRAVWGVVPQAPERKQDLSATMITGSAVAVAPGRLIAACRTISNRDRVGLVRHNKYRIGRVAAVSDDGTICNVAVDDTPLTVATGLRNVDDLQLGEEVYVLVNRTSADLALASGQVMAKARQGGIKTDVMLERAVDSAPVLDKTGNLIGLATGPAPDGNGTLVTGIPAGVAPQLAVRDRGAPNRWATLLSGPPDAIGGSGFSLFPLEADEDEE